MIDFFLKCKTESILLARVIALWSIFYDAARARINHRIFAGFAGRNLRKLAGYGLGAEWTTKGGGFVRAWYARKAGSEEATAEPDRTSRFWTQAGVVF